MQHIISPLMQVLRKGILLVTLVCLFNVVGWFSIFIEPSYAVSSPQEALSEIEKDLATQNPEDIYEEATEISKDPKMGVEKQYEKELKEYRQENSQGGGLLKGAKELVNKVTSNE